MYRNLLIFLTFLSVSFIGVSAPNYERQQSVVNSSECSRQYVLDGIVYLGAEFPAAGVVVFVKSNGEIYSTVVDQYGSFRLSFEPADSWEIGLKGYKTNEYECLISKTPPTFRVYINIKPKQ